MHNLAFFLQDSVDTTQAQHIAMAMMAIFPIIFLIGTLIVVLPFWFICKKAGFSPWLSLINIVPLGTLVLLYVLAFAEWKVVPAPVQAWVPQPPYPPQPPLPPQV
jgi:hypothetical protein